MLRGLRYSSILCACFLTTACGSLTVREPAYKLPPIPAELTQPCQEPEQIPDGKFQTLYLQLYRDVEPWRECRVRQARLAELVKYRQQVEESIRSQNQSAAKPWWKFWAD